MTQQETQEPEDCIILEFQNEQGDPIGEAPISMDDFRKLTLAAKEKGMKVDDFILSVLMDKLQEPSEATHN